MNWRRESALRFLIYQSMCKSGIDVQLLLRKFSFTDIMLMIGSMVENCSGWSCMLCDWRLETGVTVTCTHSWCSYHPAFALLNLLIFILTLLLGSIYVVYCSNQAIARIPCFLHCIILIISNSTYIVLYWSLVECWFCDNLNTSMAVEEIGKCINWWNITH